VVRVLVTGNELVEPGEELGPAQIYNSNGTALASAVRAIGANVRHGCAGDDPDELVEHLRLALDESDVVITSGGVSVGQHDLVRGALQSLGVTELVWRIAIKPGKPFYFGTAGEKLVFGLPGNPVSALATYVLLCRPALLRLMGSSRADRKTYAVVEGEASAKNRTEFVRGKLRWEGGQVLVEAVEHQGSHMLGALATADCLIHVPAGAALKRGSVVEYTELRW
jgi:molybdopterin molybdotransferase